MQFIKNSLTNVIPVPGFCAMPHSIPVVSHPPHSPDFTPCDFFLFPRLKSTLKGKQF
jgi:hypothetical protein